MFSKGVSWGWNLDSRGVEWKNFSRLAIARHDPPCNTPLIFTLLGRNTNITCVDFTHTQEHKVVMSFVMVILVNKMTTVTFTFTLWGAARLTSAEAV